MLRKGAFWFLISSSIVVSCASSPAGRRETWVKHCVIGTQTGPECQDEIVDVANDCQAGDQASCQLACLRDRRRASAAAACESSCRAGVATSCGIRGALLADEASGAGSDRALGFLVRACDGGDGNSCALQAKLKKGLPAEARLALFVKGCERNGPTACLLAGINELGHDKIDRAREHFERGSRGDRDRIIARAYWSHQDREAGSAVTAFAGCLSADATYPAAQRQRDCLTGDAYVSEHLGWGKLFEGSALAHAPGAKGGGAANTFDLSAIPAARGWYCYSIQAKPGYEITGTSSPWTKREACFLTQEDCSRQLPRIDANLVSGNIHPATDKPACGQTRSETPSAYCTTFNLNGRRGYACHDDQAKCEGLQPRGSACVPLPRNGAPQR